MSRRDPYRAQQTCGMSWEVNLRAKVDGCNLQCTKNTSTVRDKFARSSTNRDCAAEIPSILIVVNAAACVCLPRKPSLQARYKESQKRMCRIKVVQMTSVAIQDHNHATQGHQMFFGVALANFLSTTQEERGGGRVRWFVLELVNWPLGLAVICSGHPRSCTKYETAAPQMKTFLIHQVRQHAILSHWQQRKFGVFCLLLILGNK